MKKLSLNAILALTKKLETDQKRVNFEGLDREALREGVRVSAQSLKQPEDISLTPYSKNALSMLDKKDYLYVTDPQTKMESYYEAETLKLLKKYCPTGQDGKYNTDLSPVAIDHYYVDC